MTHTQSIVKIKTILNRNISHRENLNEAIQFAMSLGLSFITATKTVEEIDREEPWYRDALYPAPLNPTKEQAAW